MAKRRPAGDGMVRKRDDGRWEGRIVIGHRENGEPLFRHVYAKTQKALLDKLHQNIECYRDVELTEDSRMTLGEWLDRWLAEYKAGTVRRYPRGLPPLHRILHQAAAGRQADLPPLPAGHPADVPPPKNGGAHPRTS